MNFNTLLLRLGIDEDSFENKAIEPIKVEEGFIYEAYQKVTSRICPFCGSNHTHIHQHDIVEINCSSNDYIRDILRIYKVRLKCLDCHKTFTLPIKGLESSDSISYQTKLMIQHDFFKVISFKEIGEKYDLSTARIIQLFDEFVPVVPKKIT